MSTDTDWEAFAQDDPYYAVLTAPEFHAGRSRDKFFTSGEEHFAAMISGLRTAFPAPECFDIAVDFGCGVGRLLFPMARRSRLAIGVDVAPAMLEECRRNAAEFGLRNIELYKSDDALSALSSYRRRVSLITSALVFQHIPPQRGAGIFSRLIELLAPGGLAHLHVTFASRIEKIPLEATVTTGWQFGFFQRLGYDGIVRLAATEVSVPVMQVNHYNLNELVCILFAHGISKFLMRSIDHDGILGAELLFQVPMGQ